MKITSLQLLSTGWINHALCLCCSLTMQGPKLLLKALFHLCY